MENVSVYTSPAVPDAGFSEADRYDAAELPEITVEGIASDFSEPPEREYVHSRAAEKRGGGKLLMTVTALLGAAAGALIVIAGKTDPNAAAAISERLSRGFSGAFFQKLIMGTGCLAAEFLLGFFALGDLLVWVVPLFMGMGAGLSAAAVGRAELLPSALGILACGIIGAAVSGNFSEMLRSCAGGKSRFSDSFPARSYTAKFALLEAAAVLAAVYEGIIAQFVV